MDAQLVVLFARKFGWTPEVIGELSPQQASEIANELAYQEAVEDYKESFRFAFVASIMTKLWSKRGKSPQQLIGQMPTRENFNSQEARLFALARETRNRERTQETAGERDTD